MSLSASVALYLAAGAGALPPVPVLPVTTATVVAKQETVPVGTAAADAADDPAIWRNPIAPARSLIVATDKKAGLYVYGMDGKVRHFVAGGRLNNVDLIDMGRTGVIVVASDRNDEAQALLQIYRLNTQSGELTALGSVTGGQGEAYGVCLMRSGRALDAFSVLKHGAIHRVSISFGKDAPSGRVVQSMQLATQTEGCVADSRTDTLYVGKKTAASGLLISAKRSTSPASSPRWTVRTWSPMLKGWHFFPRENGVAGLSPPAKVTMPMRSTICPTLSPPGASALPPDALAALKKQTVLR